MINYSFKHRFFNLEKIFIIQPFLLNFVLFNITQRKNCFEIFTNKKKHKKNQGEASRTQIFSVATNNARTSKRETPTTRESKSVGGRAKAATSKACAWRHQSAIVTLQGDNGRDCGRAPLKTCANGGRAKEGAGREGGGGFSIIWSPRYLSRAEGLWIVTS